MKTRHLIIAASALIAISGAGGSIQQHLAKERDALKSAWWDCKTARQKLQIFEPARTVYRSPHAQALREQGWAAKLDEDEAWMADLISKTEFERDQSCPKVAEMDLDAAFPSFKQ